MPYKEKKKRNNPCRIQQDVSLRPLKSSDLLSFAKWASDLEVTQFLMWDAYTSYENMEKFLKESVESHPWFMAIVYHGEVVGSITLDLNTGKNACRAELGYVLARKHWGKGITTLAVKKMIDTAFHELKIDRIESFVDPNNVGSMRVCEKVGMVREGLLRNYVIHKEKTRDRYVYAIYKEKRK